MINKEKVIKIIDELISEAQKEPTWKTENALRCLKKELLKEQEAIEPIATNHIVFGTSRKCSKCNMYLFPAGRYCPHCGRSVMWE